MDLAWLKFAVAALNIKGLFFRKYELFLTSPKEMPDLEMSKIDRTFWKKPPLEANDVFREKLEYIKSHNHIRIEGKIILNRSKIRLQLKEKE